MTTATTNFHIRSQPLGTGRYCKNFENNKLVMVVIFTNHCANEMHLHIINGSDGTVMRKTY